MMKMLIDTDLSFEIFAPAKINLMLAVTGMRDDGFHDLKSVAAPLDFGDKLLFTWDKNLVEDILDLKGSSELIIGTDNLILRALRLFREHVMLPPGAFRILLEKSIPVGAGLGGGSSDAVSTLEGVNRLFGNPLSEAALMKIAGSIGSDCTLFVKKRPVLMEGRGERVSELPEFVSDYLSGKKILLFKIPLGIETAWAYGQMRKNPQVYSSCSETDALMHSWIDPTAKNRFRLYNNFEQIVFRKYPIIGVCLNLLRERHIPALMSGSGSACFCLLDKTEDETKLVNLLKEFAGESLFVQRSSFLPQ